jgi:hypothetical protein
MLDPFLRHVTKDSYGPVSFTEKTPIPVVVHRFHDTYSILGWGKMPDVISNRGRVSAGVFSLLNQRYLSQDSWKTFLRSPDALSFRKSGASIAQSGNVSSNLNEVADRLPIRSNYVGAVDEREFKALDSSAQLSAAKLFKQEVLNETKGDCPLIFPVVEYFAEEKVPTATVMGRTSWDYSIWRKQASPKILPFTFLCHFALTEDSISSLKTDAISIPKTASHHTLQPGVSWDFPVVEMVLSQDPQARRIGLSEALWITGMAPAALQDLMLSAAWIAAWARFQVKATTLNLESIDLRFALLADGSPVLVDGFTLDDMKLEKEGVRFQFEAAVAHYQKTSWYDAVIRARSQAVHQGWADWRRQCVEPVPVLDPSVRAKIEEEYRTLARCFLGNSRHVL